MLFQVLSSFYTHFKEVRFQVLYNMGFVRKDHSANHNIAQKLANISAQVDNLASYLTLNKFSQNF